MKNTTKTFPQSIRFTKEEKKRILRLSPSGVNSYVIEATRRRLVEDEAMIKHEEKYRKYYLENKESL